MTQPEKVEQIARTIASPTVPTPLGLAGLALFCLWLAGRVGRS